LTPPFFGLGSDYRAVLHQTLFYILDNGPGFSWSELYTMPIDLRRFYQKLVVKKVKERNEVIEAQNKKVKSIKGNLPNIPRKK